jgi:hypothetical protein
MIKERHIEATVFVSLAIAIPLIAFALDGVSFLDSITGFAVKEITVIENTPVIVSGIEFKAVINDKTYFYMFTEDKEWFESKDELAWEKRDDMGYTMWSGLQYLQSYGADIYFKDKLITDLTEFARGMG